ncbi:hypothetical protein F7734_22935 [Scytonema sp. UIC 10036]|uniref:hypothetical protein n=1 Tax=Scytonema sp. UIC 10036 TaxID=2304196 RepID=UPI0012DA9860|nr:hypothetical protein [Scytonema sp. UIC 10036]MUG95063.1 hypothetical protein [Scytonema sp. UIC 10036]
MITQFITATYAKYKLKIGNWQQRRRRPLLDSIKFARTKFEQIWVADGTTRSSFVSQAQKPGRRKNRAVGRKDMYSN